MAGNFSIYVGQKIVWILARVVYKFNAQILDSGYACMSSGY